MLSSSFTRRPNQQRPGHHLCLQAVLLGRANLHIKQHTEQGTTINRRMQTLTTLRTALQACLPRSTKLRKCTCKQVLGAGYTTTLLLSSPIARKNLSQLEHYLGEIDGVVVMAVRAGSRHRIAARSLQKVARNRPAVAAHGRGKAGTIQWPAERWKAKTL